MQQILRAAPSVIFALVLAFCISKVLELKLFQSEIDTRVAAMAKEKTKSDQDKINALTKGIDLLKAENDTLQHSLQSATLSKKQDNKNSGRQQQSISKHRSKALVKIEQEIDKLERIRKQRREKKEDTYALTHQITTLSDQKALLHIKIAKAKKARQNNVISEQQKSHQLAIKSRIKNNNANILGYQQAKEKIEAQRQAKIQSLDGIMPRLDALGYITKNNTRIWWTDFLIFFLLIALETTPMIIKIVKQRNQSKKQKLKPTLYHH